jgi:hypothetical protein
LAVTVTKGRFVAMNRQNEVGQLPTTDRHWFPVNAWLTLKAIFQQPPSEVFRGLDSNL